MPSLYPSPSFSATPWFGLGSYFIFTLCFVAFIIIALSLNQTRPPTKPFASASEQKVIEFRVYEKDDLSHRIQSARVELPEQAFTGPRKTNDEGEVPLNTPLGKQRVRVTAAHYHPFDDVVLLVFGKRCEIPLEIDPMYQSANEQSEQNARVFTVRSKTMSFRQFSITLTLIMSLLLLSLTGLILAYRGVLSTSAQATTVVATLLPSSTIAAQTVITVTVPLTVTPLPAIPLNVRLFASPNSLTIYVTGGGNIVDLSHITFVYPGDQLTISQMFAVSATDTVHISPPECLRVFYGQDDNVLPPQCGSHPDVNDKISVNFWYINGQYQQFHLLNGNEPIQFTDGNGTSKPACQASSDSTKPCSFLFDPLSSATTATHVPLPSSTASVIPEIQTQSVSASSSNVSMTIMTMTATNTSFTIILSSPVDTPIDLSKLRFHSEHGDLSFKAMFANVNASQIAVNSCYHAVVSGLNATPPPPSVHCVGKSYTPAQIQLVDNFWYDPTFGLPLSITVINGEQTLRQACQVVNTTCTIAL